MTKQRAESPRKVGLLTAGVLRIIRSIRRLPADLAAVVVAVCVADLLVLTPFVRETFVRTPVGLAFLLFVPGYALMAALFPGSKGDERVEPTTDDAARWRKLSDGVDGVERVALSFAFSLVVAPLVVLAFNFTPWGVRLAPVLVGLSALTLGSVAIAARRRRSLPPDERFGVQSGALLPAMGIEGRPESRGELVVNAALVLALVLAVSTVSGAILFPQQGESFTEFYVLTGSETGDLTAGDYPTQFTVGEGRELMFAVGNREQESVDYHVLVRLQSVEVTNDSATVLRSEELAEFSRTVDRNSTWRRRHVVTPTFSGTNLRLQYLLYRDDVPSGPSADSAYRHLHFWINASETE